MRALWYVLISLFALPAAAAECVEQIRAVGEQLASSAPFAERVDAPAGKASAAASSVASSEDNAGMKGVPNTGGVAANPPEPTTSSQRDRITRLLQEARAADTAGDHSDCMSKLAEARRLAQTRDGGR